MHYDSLISLNIVYKNSILNDKYPILFYWNGIDDPIEDIKKDEKIIAKLKDTIKTEDLYLWSTINYVTYKFDGENDIYEEKQCFVKNWFSYNEIGQEISQNIIIEILKEAYNKVYGVDCDITWLNSFEEQVKQIVKGIRNHYEKHISKETLVNYIRKTFKDKYVENTPVDMFPKNEEHIVNLADSTIEE